MEKRQVVGIDLGTTFSSVAYMNELGKPEIIPNRDGERLTPSVVFFQEDVPIVGSMAKRSAATAPYDVVQFVKRSMGDPAWKFMTSTGASYGPEEVSAIILRRLKEDAEFVLGERTVTDAVITVPAYFDDIRRRATMDAGRIAGINVRRVLNEPTAAALAYGFDSEVGGTLLVYDLGGGTFDVTVMRVGTGDFDVIATGGDRNLGGFEWDNALMQRLNEQYMDLGGHDLLDDDETVADLRERAEMAKRSLTTMARTNVIIGRFGETKKLEVTREEFEDVTQGLLNRTRDISLLVLEDSGLSWKDIDRVLLVGGSTRMPMVREMIETLAGSVADRSINPDEVVSLGAAVQAYLTQVDSGEVVPTIGPDSQRVTIKDVTSQSLGVVALDGDGQLRNSIIIPHNTKIPTKRNERYSTIRDNQSAINIQVTEGNDDDLDYVTIKGEKELPIPAYPRGAPIEIFFAYDIDQTIVVDVRDVTADAPLGSFEIDTDNLTELEVSEKRAKVGDLDIG